jgi:YVTN family beta-propeller protein
VTQIRLQDLGFGANAKPHHIAVEPDGSFWYVTLIGENRILKFTRDNRLVGQAQFEVPGLLALRADRDELYVGRSMSAVNPPMRIGVIDTNDMSIDEVDVFFPRPHALDIRPQGDFVYSASLGVNQMGSLNTETQKFELINVEGPTHALAHSAMAPDGSVLVITTHSNKVMIFDLANPAMPKLAVALDVADQPWSPVYTPDGRWLYVPNNASNDVTVVDMRARKVVKTIEHARFAQPYGSAVSPDGRHVFVANNSVRPAQTGHEGHAAGAAQPAATNGSVSVIDVATNEVVKVIDVGRGPTGMGIRRPAH